MSREKIFTIRLGTETYEELQSLAEERNLKVADLMRMFIRLGLIALADTKEGPRLMLKDGDELRPVLLV
jgi:hypothetical protein